MQKNAAKKCSPKNLGPGKCKNMQKYCKQKYKETCKKRAIPEFTCFSHLFCICFAFILHFFAFSSSSWNFLNFGALTGGSPKNAKNTQFQNLHFFAFFFPVACLFVFFIFFALTCIFWLHFFCIFWLHFFVFSLHFFKFWIELVISSSFCHTRLQLQHETRAKCIIVAGVARLVTGNH